MWILLACASPVSNTPDAPKADVGVDTVAEAADSETSPVTDADGDGSDASSDCDDTRPDVHPGAAEACDGVDQDCDGAVDEGGSDRFAGWPGPIFVDSFLSVTSLVVADLDRDGNVDLAMDVDAGVEYLLGAGRRWTEAGEWVGDWTELEIDPPQEGPTALVAADLDGDGWVDLVRANVATRTEIVIGWFRNDTGTGFEPWAELARGEPDLTQAALLVADFDADGQVDLVYSDLAWWGDDTGFKQGPDIGRSTAAATLLPDGRWAVGATSAMLAPTADHTWETIEGEDRCAAFVAPQTPGVDLSGDGRSDVVSVPRPIFVCEDDGAGGLTVASELAPAGPYSGETVLGTWDATGDGLPDLAILHAEDDVRLYNGTASGLQPAQQVRLPRATADGLIAWADWGETTSLLVCDTFYLQCVELIPDGTGRYPSATEVELTGFTSTVTAALPVDRDGDGDLDIFAIGEQAVRWIEHGAGRDLAEVEAADTELNASTELRLAADLDGDGAVEVVGSDDDSRIWIFRGTSTSSTTAPTRSLVNGCSMDLLAADLDGDGDAELLEGPYAWGLWDRVGGQAQVWGLDGGEDWADLGDGGRFDHTFAFLNLGDEDADGREELLSIESGGMVRLQWGDAGWEELERRDVDWDSGLADGTWVAAAVGVNGTILVLEPDVGELVRVDPATGVIDGRWDVPDEMRAGATGHAPSDLVHVGVFDDQGSVGVWRQGWDDTCVGELWTEAEGELVERTVGCLGFADYRLRAADLDGDGFVDLMGADHARVGVLWGAPPSACDGP